MSKARRNYLAEIDHFHGAELEYRVATDSWQFQGNAVTPGTLVRILAHALDAPNQKISNALEVYSLDQYRLARKETAKWLEEIERQPTDDSTLRAWLQSMQHADTSELEHEAHVAAVKQWIWQVKQGILGRPITWHVAPILWCKQNGTGKTFQIRRIVEPLYRFTRELKVEELDEKFSAKMLSRTLVVVLDEFEGCRNDQVSVVKSILTGKPFDRRGMHSESGFFAENRLSCIATSNQAPPHGFHDETGARRFWSIHSREEQILPGSELAHFYGTLDLNAWWMAVRSTDEAPTTQLTPELATYMAQRRDELLRSKSSLETFMAECTLEEADIDLDMKSLLDAYSHYCSVTGLLKLKLSQEKAAQKLTNLGFKCVKPGNRYKIKSLKILPGWFSPA